MRRSTNNSSVSRRNFLKYGVVGITGLISAVLAIPLVRYFISPALGSTEKDWAVIARTADVPVGKPIHVEYEQRMKDSWVLTTHRKGAWIVTQDGQNFTVFDPHCTHLGCPYTWTEEPWKGEGPYKGQPHFHCPCHEGIYTIDGTVISGPPPRPLDRLLTKVEGDSILAKEA
ncbi:MAG: ubiquinol-cytochrome c reductase iron-sulfur subunit [Dehalococcoidia bacterium]|nr:ubiquinol-cytochrome c reductase iron-sulfur subunit [Dehalococcoidia bacterium]